MYQFIGKVMIVLVVFVFYLVFRVGVEDCGNVNCILLWLRIIENREIGLGGWCWNLVS